MHGPLEHLRVNENVIKNLSSKFLVLHSKCILSYICITRKVHYSRSQLISISHIYLYIYREREKRRSVVKMAHAKLCNLVGHACVGGNKDVDIA